MRRLVAYLNSLLLGVIAGMMFVAIFYATPHRQEGFRADGIIISYQVIGSKQQKTFLLFAGRVTRLAEWSPELYGQSVDRGYRLASPVIAISISRFSPVRLQQACSLKK